MAVEESASAEPTTIDAGPLTAPALASVTATAMAAVEMATCRDPSPKTNLPMDCRRSSESSRPMWKRRNTTPSSAMCLVTWTCETMPVL